MSWELGLWTYRGHVKLHISGAQKPADLGGAVRGKWRVCAGMVLAFGFAGLAGAATTVASAAPGNSGAAAACQKGGFAILFRGDGSGFGNVGGCVSYAAHGGTLETQCQPGSFSSTGVSPCSAADVGFYVATAGATSETPCPSGETTAGTGSTSSAACFSENPGGTGGGSGGL